MTNVAKYWKGGDPNYIYQYHTMDIEDGRDEREQLPRGCRHEAR